MRGFLWRGGGLTLALLTIACGQAATAEQGGAPAPAAVSEEGGGDGAVGTWIRQATYTNGQLMHEEPATLVITATTFDSAAEACDNSGGLQLDPERMVMTVQQSSCPSIVNVGSVVTYSYTVEGDDLTIVNTEFGAEVSEVYRRQD